MYYTFKNDLTCIKLVLILNYLQQLEQTILAQQSTPHNQQQQLQQRVQQILQQKQQLQQQIKQFQQQVEQQLAYTQHASPQLLAPPQLPAVTNAGGKQAKQQGTGGEGDPVAGDGGYNLEDAASITTVPASDLNFLMCADQIQGFIQGPGKKHIHLLHL